MTAVASRKAADSDLQGISLSLLQLVCQLLTVLPLTLQHAQQGFIVDLQVSNLLLLWAAAALFCTPCRSLIVLLWQTELG